MFNVPPSRFSFLSRMNSFWSSITTTFSVLLCSTSVSGVLTRRASQPQPHLPDVVGWAHPTHPPTSKCCFIIYRDDGCGRGGTLILQVVEDSLFLVDGYNDDDFHLIDFEIKPFMKSSSSHKLMTVRSWWWCSCNICQFRYPLTRGEYR